LARFGNLEAKRSDRKLPHQLGEKSGKGSSKIERKKRESEKVGEEWSNKGSHPEGAG